MKFKNFPIRRKLMFSFLLTTFVVLVLTCSAFFTYEIVTLRKSMVEGYQTRALIIAANSTAALAFQNSSDATEVLAALKTDPRILMACIYDAQGKLFAKYPADGPDGIFPAKPGRSGYGPGFLDVFGPVVQDGRALGTVYLRSDLSSLTQRYWAYGWLMLAVIVASLLLVFLLSNGLQRHISGPILALAETAQAVSRQGDFSVRARKFGEDELGSLTDAFNRMLGEIQARDQALKISENNYRKAVEAIDDYAILVMDRDGKVMTWNEGVQKIKGYKAEEIIGKDFSIFYTPEDLKAGKPSQLLDQAARQGRVEVEGWRVRKDGTRFLADVMVTPLRDEKGGLRGFVKITRDITDRKKAEEEIRQTNSFLNAVLENIPNMIFVKDAKELRFLRFNKAGEELLGFPRQDLMGKNDYDFFPKEQADFFTAKDRAVLDGGKLLDIPEEIIETKNKGKRTLHTKKIPIRDKDGNLQYLLGISEDITESKEAQREIQEKTQLLDSILKNVGDGVIASDEKGKFLVFNPAAEKILGRGAVEGGSGQWVEKFGVFRPDGVTPFPESELPLVKAIRGEVTNNVEQFLRNEGNPEGVSISVSGRPLKDETGRILGGVVIVRDITDEKRQMERELYTKALEVSNKEMQDFVFVASHDLQEPLRKIQSFGEFLRDEFKEALGETGKDYVDRMRSAASRMQILINDLLALTRVTTKAQPFVPVDLSEVIRGVLSDLETRIKEKNAKVEVGNLPTLDADTTQMRQLFQNLIGNALKFQKPGVPSVVKVSATVPESGRSSSRQCVIKVEDNGIGFDNKYAEQIFKVFERLHGRDEYEGTGIGLAICKKVVERHNGSIRVESLPGKGSTFIVSLPVQQKR